MHTHNKKMYNKPKNKTLTTKNPEASTIGNFQNVEGSLKPPFPLLAKDSEWVDILQATTTEIRSTSTSGDEEVVESEDGQLIKPLALMFPGLLEKDPEMLEGMLNKLMSTTEITKHLVGQKANFTCMKKVDRLIPTDKEWLDSVTEMSNSCSSLQSRLESCGTIKHESNSHDGQTSAPK